MEKGMDMTSTLLNSTVRVIARNGLDKASVRIISADCNMPNPYIYQFFKDKDDLFVRAFEREDAALASEFENFFSMYEATKDTQSRCLPSMDRALELHDGESGGHHSRAILLFHVLTKYPKKSICDCFAPWQKRLRDVFRRGSMYM